MAQPGLVLAQPAPAVKRAAPPASSRVTTHRPALVDVEVRVSPTTARISVDGTEVGGNPFSSRYAGDDVAHHVRASAPGYIAKSITVMFNANLTLDLSLERSAPSTGPAAIALADPRPGPPVKPAREPAERQVGKLAITTTLPDCEITIDGVPVGTTPLREPIAVLAGRRKVTVMRAGYLEQTRFVDVAAAHTVPLDLSFTGAAIDAGGGSRPVRPIDARNPYTDR
jgi:hypothetical protein